MRVFIAHIIEPRGGYYKWVLHEHTSTRLYPKHPPC